MISNNCDVIFITVRSISHLLQDDKHSLDAGHQLRSREECCSLLYSIQAYVKGRVHIRKSKSGEKWNDRFVNDAYGVIMHRCCTSKLCPWKCQILHDGCALKRERWVSYVFLPKLTYFKDLKYIFHYQRTPALVILLQHINKVGDFSY